jgi:hypothetical protein
MNDSRTSTRTRLGRHRPYKGLMVIILPLLVPLVFWLVSGPAAASQNPDRGPAGGEELVYLPMVERGCQTYHESGGLLIMEVEHAPTVPHWQAETNLVGFTGDSYYTWRGPNFFGTPGVGTLTYKFRITTPGLYNFRLHNRHDFHDPTEENDVWARINNNPWTKVFSWERGHWTWTTAFDVGGNISNAAYIFGATEYTLQISGRSYGFSIDRIVMFITGVTWDDLNLPVSDCS